MPMKATGEHLRAGPMFCYRTEKRLAQNQWERHLCWFRVGTITFGTTINTYQGYRLDVDEWGAMDPTTSTSAAEPPRDLWDFDQEPVYPTLTTKPSQPRRLSSTSTTPSTKPTPQHSPPAQGRSLSSASKSNSQSEANTIAKPETHAPSTANMTKEEKAAEMARRREERKQVGAAFLFYPILVLTSV